MDTVRESILVLDRQLRVVLANRSFYKLFQVTPEQTLGCLLYELGDGQWNIQRLRELLENIIPEEQIVEDFEVMHDFPTIGLKVMLLNARRLQQGEEHVLLVIEDITARYRERRALLRSESMCRMFTEEANCIVIGVNVEGEITFFNRFCERIFQYDRHEVEGKKLVGTIIPGVDSRGHDNSRLIEQMVSSPEQFYMQESEGVRKDGERVWFSWSVNVDRDPEGRIEQFLIDGNDITKFALLRREFEEKSAVLDTIMDFIPEGVVITDAQNYTRRASREMAKMLGVPMQLIVGRCEEVMMNGFHFASSGGRPMLPDQLPSHKAMSSVEGYYQYEFEYKQDGTTMVLSVNAAPIRGPEGKIMGAVEAWRDVTESKKIEAALSQSEKRFRAAVDNYTSVFVIYDSERRIQFINKMGLEVSGLREEDVLGHRDEEIIPAEVHRKYLPYLREVFNKGEKQHFEYSFSIQGKSYTNIVDYVPLFDEEGKLTQVLGITVDITQRRRAEKALERNERRLKQILEQLPVGVGVLDIQGKFTLKNAIMNTYVPGIMAPSVDSQIQDTFQAFDVQGNPVSVEHWPVSRALSGETVSPGLEFRKVVNGHEQWASVSSAPLRSEEGVLEGVLLVGVEITERKRMEELLQARQQRYSALFNAKTFGIAQCRVLSDQSRSDFLVEEVNKTFTDILNLTKEEIGGKLITQIFPGVENRYREYVDMLCNVGRYDKDVQFEFFFDVPQKWIYLYAFKTVPGEFVIIFTDISGRKSIEDHLRESEQNFRTLADNISQLVWMADPSGEIFWYNQRWFEATGTTYECMKEYGFELPVHPDHLQSVRSTLKNSFEKGTSWELTFPMKMADGEYRWFLARANPIRNEKGSIIRWFATNTDISEIKRIQEELQLSANQFQSVLSSSIVGTVIAEPDGNFQYANDYYLDLIGYSRDEFRKISWMDITPEEHLPADYRAIEEVKRTGNAAPYEKEYVRRDGTRVWVLLALRLLPGTGSRIFGFVLDISERKRALSEAQERRAEVEAILNSLPDGFIIYGNDGNIRQINDRARDVLGYTKEIISQAMEQRVKPLRFSSPDGQLLNLSSIPSFRALQGETVRDKVVRISRKDRDFWVSMSASPIRTQGKITGAVMEFSDFTELHYLQEQLTIERNFSDAILQTSGALILVVDPQGRVIKFNKACEDLSGFSSEEMLNEPFFKLVPESELPALKQALGQLISDWKLLSYENNWISKDGKMHYIRWRNTALPDANGVIQFIVATGIDITDRLNMEKELDFRAKELESFSYSVSHDLRTPLAVISNFSSILSEEYADRLDEEGRDFLSRISLNVIKMQSLIDDILALSRISKQEVRRENVDISEMVSSYLSELQKTEPGRKIEITVEKNVYAFVDPRLIHVALENLLRNSWKYTSKKDVTKIEFGTISTDVHTVFFIRDNGAGFDMQFALKIFEPFRRVHAEKEFAGTGVGLSIVQRVIALHGGRVWAEGEVGKGATFYFEL